MKMASSSWLLIRGDLKAFGSRLWDLVRAKHHDQVEHPDGNDHDHQDVAFKSVAAYLGTCCILKLKTNPQQSQAADEEDATTLHRTCKFRV